MTSELTDGSIFLHVPKTGGTWTYKVLSELGLIRRFVGRHDHADFTRAVLYPDGKPRWREWSVPANRTIRNLISPGRYTTFPFTFCFVRHPVSWYESSWRFLNSLAAARRVPWMNAEGRIKRWHPFHIPCLCLDEDLGRYVRNMMGRFPGFVTWLYGLYAPAEVGFVGKQENLCDDLIRVLRVRGMRVDEGRVRGVPRANESRGQVRWDGGILREVQEVEVAAMRRFGYERVESSSEVQGRRMQVA